MGEKKKRGEVVNTVATQTGKHGGRLIKDATKTYLRTTPLAPVADIVGDKVGEYAGDKLEEKIRDFSEKNKHIGTDGRNSEGKLNNKLEEFIASLKSNGGVPPKDGEEVPPSQQTQPDIDPNYDPPNFPDCNALKLEQSDADIPPVSGIPPVAVNQPQKISPHNTMTPGSAPAAPRF